MLKFSDGQAAAILGFHIYYGDGSISIGQSGDDWKDAPVENVQCVVVFYSRTYECHTGKEFETFNYVELFSQADYYWYSPTVGYGRTPDEITSDAVIKHGKWSNDFLDFYNRALQDRVWA